MVFSQNELIVMIGVVSVLLLCITILTILDVREYLKVKKGLVSDDEELEEYQEDIIKPEPVQVVLEEDKKPEEVMVTAVSNNNDDMLFEEMEDVKFESKETINPIIQEVEEDVSAKENIQEEIVVPQIMEVEEDKVTPEINIQEEVEPVIEKKPKKKLEIFEELDELEERLPNKLDDITNFEMEQERTAIISLDELMKKSDELYNDNEYVQYDDGNEPITIDEVISRFRNESEPVIKEVKEDVSELPLVMQKLDEEVVPYQRKETIPFISSVYGIEKDSNALEFENTATYEKLDRQKYNDFVAKLREMNEKE